MRKNELVYYYALDRKWMSTEQANLLLQRAEEDGLLGQANGIFSPRFDIIGYYHSRWIQTYFFNF